MEGKTRHLDFIQLTITRMAANSFLLKGWTVTLVAGLFAIAAGTNRPSMILFAAVPIIMFWSLDAFYLNQARSFRKLYDDVRQRPDDQIDFSLDARRFSRSNGWLLTALSKTVVGFYGPILLTVLVLRCWL